MRIFGFGITIMIISNKEREDIVKIVDSLKDSDILLKEFIKTSENEAKKRYILW